MKKDTEALKYEIIHADCIESCPKPDLNYSLDENYIFISYSHLDYGKVFPDLIDFSREGVRFWYDRGMHAGDNWKKRAEEKIRSSYCNGILFYLSENLFLSESVLEEIRYMKENRKKYFYISPSGKSPSEIINEIIRSRTPAELERIRFKEKIKILSDVFSDDVIFYSATDNACFSRTLETLNRFGVVPPFLIRNGILVKYRGNEAIPVIPEVSTIGPKAFENCSALETVILPPTLIIIGDEAFKGCTNLKTIAFGPSIQK